MEISERFFCQETSRCKAQEKYISLAVRKTKMSEGKMVSLKQMKIKRAKDMDILI